MGEFCGAHQHGGLQAPRCWAKVLGGLQLLSQMEIVNVEGLGQGAPKVSGLGPGSNSRFRGCWAASQKVH